MANPLTLYVPIKQDKNTQLLATIANAGFAALVKTGLDSIQNVHFARMALIPNAVPDPETGALYNAILLMTEFDFDMTTYLSAFWFAPGGGVKNAFIGIAKLALNPPSDPEKFEIGDFVKFITENNLNKDVNNNYSAYPQLVTDILQAFPPEQ